ncbi:MAG: hypothetical protein CMM93_03160 [Rickettsiales bacterium]|nr:hypothetical protein [Rickettsiales bacterium]|tara:strand:- start:614 stop:1126 length:513 start_codon:yes stop_codon:yes gene_type:complete
MEGLPIIREINLKDNLKKFLSLGSFEGNIHIYKYEFEIEMIGFMILEYRGDQIEIGWHRSFGMKYMIGQIPEIEELQKTIGPYFINDTLLGIGSIDYEFVDSEIAWKEKEDTLYRYYIGCIGFALNVTFHPFVDYPGGFYKYNSKTKLFRFIAEPNKITFCKLKIKSARF